MRTLLLVCALLPACSPSPITVLEKPTSDRYDYSRGRYNRVYSDPNQQVFADRPNQFLLDCLPSLSRRGAHSMRAIDLGAGQGRNTFPLAQAGYTVTAIDLSPVGLAHINTVARERRLNIETIEADIAKVQLSPNSIDLAIAIYFNVDTPLAKRLEKAIKPGGAIILEGYPGQVDHKVLNEAFKDWTILTSETVTIIPDWYWGQDPKAVPVARFFARKPF